MTGASGPAREQSRFVKEILLPGGHSEIPMIDSRYCRYPLVVKSSPIDRWGIFADATIPPKRVVMEYKGEWIDNEKAGYRSLRERNYLFEWDEDWVIDGAVGGSGAQYVNHGCDPNLRFRCWRKRVLLVSLRSIAKGEELTLDYHLSREGEAERCNCGSPLCRGLINPASRHYL